MARVKSGRQVVKYLPWIVSIYLHIAVMPIEGLLPSNCDVNVFGLKVSTYCNLLEKIFLSQFRDALKQSLPLSSPRAMRQIEVKYVELQTKVREDFTLMETDQTMAFSWLKELTQRS